MNSSRYQFAIDIAHVFALAGFTVCMGLLLWIAQSWVCCGR